MHLADWITEHGYRRIDVARRLGISSGHISDLCRGRFWPSRELAQRIYDMTGGAVTPNDFLRGSNSASD
jgi:3,4-dihydroxy 2-butanone 4-phosphate synthase / GTP cyclohydrolase II